MLLKTIDTYIKITLNTSRMFTKALTFIFEN